MVKNNGNDKSHSLTRANSQELAWQHFAPTSNWTAMGKEEHFVQFYESDQFLLESLSGFIREGIQAGDACVVVATKTHQVMLEKRLRLEGLNAAELEKRG